MFAIRELYASLTILTFLSTLLVCWLKYNKYPLRGAKYWTCSFLSICASCLFITFRGTLPLTLTVLLPNNLLMLANFFSYFALRRYLSLPINRSLILTALAIQIFLPFFVYHYYVVSPSLTTRIVVWSIIVALLHAQIACDLIAYGRQTHLSKLLCYTNIFASTTYISRIIIAACYPPAGNYLASGWQTTAFLIWIIAYVLFSTLGIILMAVEEQNKELIRQVHEDPLTGLLNRRAFKAMHAKQISQKTATNASLGVLLIDIDHFKRVNDSYGHMVGDELLQFFSAEIVNCLRRDDTIFRIGGEEFFITMQNTNITEVERVAERIREHFECTPYTIGNESILMTLSIGCAITDKAEKNIEEMFSQADTALYTAKSNGRNRVEMFCDANLAESV